MSAAYIEELELENRMLRARIDRLEREAGERDGMVAHYCETERAVISCQGPCNWCGKTFQKRRPAILELPVVDRQAAPVKCDGGAK